MIARVAFHRLAAKDARDAEGWYRRRSPDSAARFRTQVTAAALRIADGVDTHPIPGTKFQYVLVRRFPYRLIFSTEGSVALVVAVSHARRRPNYWRRRH